MALRGIRVVEFAGLAPAPVCGMILADFGASVIRVDRVRSYLPEVDVTSRNKRSICIDLKDRRGLQIVKRLCLQSDVLLEPYRAGVMDKLGLGHKHLLLENPRLVYASLTGYGQYGPLAQRAGHDINYLAISGILSKLGRRDESPHPPINLLGDFAGGSLACAFGILLALFERQRSGRGQYVDANIVECAAYFFGTWLKRFEVGVPSLWNRARGENLLDGGAHFYETYRTADGKYIAVGCIEPQFYAQFLRALELSESELPQFGDDPVALQKRVAERIALRTQAEWCTRFEQFDCCATPILSLDEAPHHPHNMARGSFVEVTPKQPETAPGQSSHHNTVKSHYEPSVAPRLDRTPGQVQSFDNIRVGEHSVQILRELGQSDNDIEQLLADGIVEQATLSKPAFDSKL